MKILKIEIPLSDQVLSLNLPQGSELLAVGAEGDRLHVWVAIGPDGGSGTIPLRILFDEMEALDEEHVGTAVLETIGPVHVFRRDHVSRRTAIDRLRNLIRRLLSNQ